MAITIVGPGCSTTSACLTTYTGMNYGYQGTEALVVNNTNIRRAAAGRYLTTFWHSETYANYVGVGSAITYTGSTPVWKITRS